MASQMEESVSKVQVVTQAGSAKRSYVAVPTDSRTAQQVKPEFVYEWRFKTCQDNCCVSPITALIILTVFGFVLLILTYFIMDYVIKW
ncbi:hypothetical protein DdX_18678 [Ditylenchus destructor]|uniref:Uncharacterized protein n=1 Tax=Ditylenchus destructor TaxID=166010 RepID=A0AAD4MKR4_9BILA|nr:hypothetical protein DdX_18678 [Ditylenchus destructor]